MRTTIRIVVMAMVAVFWAAVPTDAEAQVGCFVCETNWLGWEDCVEPEEGFGRSSCEIEFDDGTIYCHLGPHGCMIIETEEEEAVAFIRSDGTVLTYTGADDSGSDWAGMGESNIPVRSSAYSRAQVRSCQQFVTARLYGDGVVRELTTRAAHLTI